MRLGCDFCTIYKEPERIIIRNRYITSLLSNPRLTLGHTLIIPNRHLTLPEELSDDEVLAIHHEATRLTERTMGSLAMGVDRWQKSRPRVPESAIKRDHLHVHILPSNPESTLYDRAIDWGGDEWTPLSPSECTRLLGLLRDEPAADS